ncbi:MAG: serine/threonine-protein kinase [Verrucomicrobiales bacterium]
MDATATTQCPTCGSSIPGDTAFGACPACLFGAALDDGGSASASGSEAESPERYQILGQIGEGAFGEVYAAEQRKPVRRRVALKLLKRGMDTRQVVARFEGERQALAVLDHANIAAVFDAGETPGGRPFIAMELVEDGVSVTDFCLRESLDLRARLSVFLQVCEAIRHAHQKGIIHRDIKPSNILVSLADGAGRTPKVIDFGIAKATEDVLSARTLYTDPGKFVGTPAYMAPEQFSHGHDVDTRADVYALGALLYELICGAPPFDPKRLRSASPAELERILKDEEPPRPSARMASPPPAVRNELDWIAARAMEKDRDRRYESASALAADVARFLHGDAVQARPPSTLYRLRKFARRHRAGIAAAAAVALALAAGAAVSAWQAHRAHEAEVAAQKRAALAETLAEILSDDIIGTTLATEDLAAEGGQFDAGRIIRALQSAEEKIGNQFADQPRFDGLARLALARLYIGATASAEIPGLAKSLAFAKAEEHSLKSAAALGEHFGPGSDRQLMAQQTLFFALTQQGKDARAAELAAGWLAVPPQDEAAGKRQRRLREWRIIALQRAGDFERVAADLPAYLGGDGWRDHDLWRYYAWARKEQCDAALEAGRLEDAARLCQEATALVAFANRPGGVWLMPSMATIGQRRRVWEAGGEAFGVFRDGKATLVTTDPSGCRIRCAFRPSPPPWSKRILCMCRIADRRCRHAAHR